MPLARARARPPSEVPSTNREEPGGLGRLSALLIFGDVVCTRCNSALRSPDFQCFKAGFAVSVCRRQGAIRGLRECFDGSFGSRTSRGPRNLRGTPSRRYAPMRDAEAKMKKNPTPKLKKLLRLYSRVYIGQHLAQDFIYRVSGLRVQGSGFWPGSVYIEAIFRLSWPLKPQPVKLSNPEPESLNKSEVLKLPTPQISKPR